VATCADLRSRSSYEAMALATMIGPPLITLL
jgi:hypothetical protein